MFGIALTLIGIVFIIICSIQVYKTAKDTGRGAAAWTVLTIAIGIGFQFVIPFVLGILIVIYYLFSGVPPERVEAETVWLLSFMNIALLILSCVGMFQVLKHVSKIPDEPLAASGDNLPPPPPFFEAQG